MLAPRFLQWPLRPTVVHNTPRAVGGTEEVAVTICLQNTSTLQDRQTLQWLPLPTHFTTHPCPYISAITQSNTTQVRKKALLIALFSEIISENLEFLASDVIGVSYFGRGFTFSN